MYMRFVNLKVREGKMRGLVKFYEERVLPALEGTKGCLYASLLQPARDDDDLVALRKRLGLKDEPNVPVHEVIEAELLS